MLWATCTVKQCELLVPFTLSRTRSVPAAWRQTFCWLWRTSVLFSPKRTSFLHSVFMWMLTVCALRESVSMCGSGRGWVCVCVFACSESMFFLSRFYLLVTWLVGEHSLPCHKLVAMCNLLCFYFALPNSHQISLCSRIISLCIIKEMPYLAPVFFLYGCSVASPHWDMLPCLCWVACTSP